MRTRFCMLIVNLYENSEQPFFPATTPIYSKKSLIKCHFHP